MGTGQDRVNIYLKKFMSQQHAETNFLNYLRQLTLDLMADMYPQEGFFYGGVMSADGNDKFQLSTPMLATDGLGHRLSLDPTYAAGIQFENALAVEYYVGLRYNDIPELTEVNVRSGEIEYSFDQEAIGELGEPDAVVDNGTTITLTVDSVTEAGVSWTSNTVKMLQNWGIVLTAFTLGFGALNLFIFHSKHISRRTEGQWLYSIWLLLIIVLFTVVGVALGPSSDQYN